MPFLLFKSNKKKGSVSDFLTFPFCPFFLLFIQKIKPKTLPLLKKGQTPKNPLAGWQVLTLDVRTKHRVQINFTYPLLKFLPLRSSQTFTVDTYPKSFFWPCSKPPILFNVVIFFDEFRFFIVFLEFFWRQRAYLILIFGRLPDRT